MATHHCMLTLVRRPVPVVDGRGFEGEVLRYRLTMVAEEAVGGDGESQATHEAYVELRISRTLLAGRAWARLLAHDVALHGQAFVVERLMADGLPHGGAVHVLRLDEHTDGGAFRDGSPYVLATFDPSAPFEVDDARGPAVTRSRQAD